MILFCVLAQSHTQTRLKSIEAIKVIYISQTVVTTGQLICLQTSLNHLLDLIWIRYIVSLRDILICMRLKGSSNKSYKSQPVETFHNISPKTMQPRALGLDLP